MFDQQPNTELEVISTFMVNQQCIDKGKIKDPNYCIIALAIKESGFEKPVVYKEGAVMFDWNGVRYVGYCFNLIEKIYVFDHGGKVLPFIFHLEDMKEFDLSNYKSVESSRIYRDTLVKKSLAKLCFKDIQKFKKNLIGVC